MNRVASHLWDTVLVTAIMAIGMGVLSWPWWLASLPIVVDAALCGVAWFLTKALERKRGEEAA